MTAELLTLISVLAAPVDVGAERPASIIVATRRGEAVVQVHMRRGYPALLSRTLTDLLPVEALQPADGWTTVTFGGEPFRFLLGAPVMEHRGTVLHLIGGAYVVDDSVFVPLQWLTEVIPSVFREGFRYDPVAARFEESGLSPVVTTVSPAPGSRPVARSSLPRQREPNEFGLTMSHTVVVDPGHGGIDPGNLGRYLPRGVNEKHVTLAVGLELERILKTRGIRVVMTRTDDRSLTPSGAGSEELAARSAMCGRDCTIFVSLHVDALRSSTPGFSRANGIHTYVWGGSRTQNARRVAAMENAALQVEVDEEDDVFSFIFKDLQVNEHHRESNALAAAIQQRASEAHPGADRGVDQANFAVLREARRPAVLIEMGYATNRGDGQFLSSRDGQRRLARGIADGLTEYLRHYETRLLAAADSQ